MPPLRYAALSIYEYDATHYPLYALNTPSIHEHNNDNTALGNQYSNYT